MKIRLSKGNNRMIHITRDGRTTKVEGFASEHIIQIANGIVETPAFQSAEREQNQHGVRSYGGPKV